MNKNQARCIPILCIGLACILGFVYSAPKEDLADQASQIFQQNCTVAGCHVGPYPAMGLDLGADTFQASLTGKLSQENKEFMLIDTLDSQKSYLLMKLRGDKRITGQRMPLNAPPLSKDTVLIVQEWIKTLSSLSLSPKPEVSNQPPIRPAFWGARLVNLVTPTTIGKKHILFRISHRFYPSVQEGYDVFYGLNGPASIYLSLGYGLTQNMDFSVGHSNRFHEWVLGYKWTFFRPKNSEDLPLSAALNTGVTWVTESQSGKKTSSSENFKYSLQLSLAYELHKNISLLLVPAYASNVNHWEENSRGTFALGTGARIHLGKDISMLFEAIPVLAGYHARATGWGIGLEKKLGGHIFQIFALNSVGLTSPQLLPGGDLCINDGDIRFGFTIFRTF